MNEHPFDGLPIRDKEPTSKRVLDQWISHAAQKTGAAERRVGWLVASNIVIAALQRTMHIDGNPRFLLKGGAYLEVRLGLRSRATKDLDTLFRGNFDEFLDVLDANLGPWGPVELSRTHPEIIEGARRVIKPQRFHVQLKIGGYVWRTIKVEVAADEGGTGDSVEQLPAAPLGHFGLPSASSLAGIALDYQVAQKIHACTDPHDPPEYINDRARDIVDLILLRDALYSFDSDLTSTKAACLALFSARLDDAISLGMPVRAWPPTVTPYPHWKTDFERAATELDLSFSFDDAVATVNQWIKEIDFAQ